MLIAMGEMYNTALLIVENNNMGHTTITTLKNQGYPRIYKKLTEDKVTKQRSEKLGWTTTGPSKNDMLNEGIRRLRDQDANILDVRLLEQMGNTTRGENGRVELNGKDRVVAYCLACIGRKHYATQARPKPKRLNSVTGTGTEVHEAWERSRRKQSNDLFD